MIAAVTLFESGHQEQGRVSLEEGIRIGEEIGNPLVLWIGGLFRAHMEYTCGNYLAGDAALECAMSLGRDHLLAHIFCWPRRIITSLIDRSLEQGFSPDYAKFLIERHAIMPGELPTRSDQWVFNVRIYTFGNARIEYADGRVEVLSPQYLRQIELLAVLIGAVGMPTPLHAIATSMYQHENVDELGSLKRVLHSLRDRVGNIVIQQDGLLRLDFRKVWIDACSVQQLRRNGQSDADIASWLDQYYQGEFMEQIECSPVVLGIRRRISGHADHVLSNTYRAIQKDGDTETLRRFEKRWAAQFPALIMRNIIS